MRKGVNVDSKIRLVKSVRLRNHCIFLLNCDKND